MPIQYILYVDNVPTKSISDTLQEAQTSANDYIAEGRDLMIQTINSPNPVQTWNYKHDIKTWVEKK